MFPIINTTTQRVVCLGNGSVTFKITFTTTNASPAQALIPLAVGVSALIVALLLFKWKYKR